MTEEKSPFCRHVMSLIPILLSVALLIALATWLLGFVVRKWALSVGFVDRPDKKRRFHDHPVAFGGGILAWAMCVIGISFISFFYPDWFRMVPMMARLGFILSPIPLLIVGILDDRYRLSSAWLLFGAFSSILLAILFGIRIERISDLSGGVLHFTPVISILVSAIWLLACTGATKFSDGVDGLVAGQTVIGSGLIVGLCLSPAFYQPEIALLAAIFGGSFLGILLHGWPRARMYLGEFGSTFAGFGIGVLALISGAKFAIALMAMGFFVADIIWVMLHRLWRGVSPLEGDRTHLHFVLLKIGLPAWSVAVLLWVLGLIFGLAALQFQTQGKLALLLAIVIFTWMLSFFATRFAARLGSKKS